MPDRHLPKFPSSNVLLSFGEVAERLTNLSGTNLNETARSAANPKGKGRMPAVITGRDQCIRIQQVKESEG